MKGTSDYLIISAGIVGLSIARKIQYREPNAKVSIPEKEPRLGVHASGRNSGVLHTGSYYPHGTLKAKLCNIGADIMFDYAQKHAIQVRLHSKVIVATSEENANSLNKLLADGIHANRVNTDGTLQIEPHARAEFGGINCQHTPVIESPCILETLHMQLAQQDMQSDTNQMQTNINNKQRSGTTHYCTYNFDLVINAVGAYAGRVALVRLIDASQCFQLTIFKGLYCKLAAAVTNRVRSSIYPVAAIRGHQFTRIISNKVNIETTTSQKHWRKYYALLRDVTPAEALGVALQLARFYISNSKNVRQLLPLITSAVPNKSTQKGDLLLELILRKGSINLSDGLSHKTGVMTLLGARGLLA